MGIKKGDSYKCVKNYEMESGEIAFIAGVIYTAVDDTTFIDANFFDHTMDVDDLAGYFEKVTDKTSQEHELGQKHYDNTNGSLYQFCENQDLNCYEFDIIKRIMRCRKKGNFIEDLEKTKFLIDLYIKENKV